MVREMIAADLLPDYHIEELEGDKIRFSSRARLLEREAAGQGGPQLSPETLEQARVLAPGWDVYALEADWRAYWHATGRPRLRSAERAFLGFVAGRRQR